MYCGREPNKWTPLNAKHSCYATDVTENSEENIEFPIRNVLAMYIN